MTKFVFVTGGAGYIGSHACKALALKGYVPVTLDNLSTGWKESVKYGPFEHVDLLDLDRLEKLFKFYRPECVFHFAAYSQVGESVLNPANYWKNNFVGSMNLINTSLDQGCVDVIFSSTCATYGEQDNIVLEEHHNQTPTSPYGASKKAVEDLIFSYGQAYGLNAVIFRYFNIAGADTEAEIGERHEPETHLIPLIFDTILGYKDSITIFGDNYETFDGTCVRDYLHVSDLVHAHTLGMDWLKFNPGVNVFNLGIGKGYSVKEVINAAEYVTNEVVPVQIGVRRDGDCAQLVSGSQKAKRLLGWHPDRSNLHRIIEDAWRWHRKMRSNYEQGKV